MKVEEYIGDKVTLDRGDLLKGNMLRERFLCDNEECSIKEKPQMKSTIVSVGGNLHSCKLDQGCYGRVLEILKNKKKLFNEGEFLRKQIEHYSLKGLDDDQAEMLATKDLKDKQRELRIKGETKTGKRKHTEDFKLRKKVAMQKSAMYVRGGMQRSEAMKKGNIEAKQMTLDQIKDYIDITSEPNINKYVRDFS